MNNEEIRPTSNLIISTCSAYDYLNHSNPNLEKLTTQYYETFSITGRFTGYFSNITIGDFFDALTDDYYTSTATLGGLNATARKESEKQSKEKSGGNSENSSQTTNSPDANDLSKTPDLETNPESLIAGTSSIIGDRGTENFGIAIFKDDKLCGQLTAVESICHLLIGNKVDSCIISIDNPLVEKLNTEDTEKMEIQLFPSKRSKFEVKLVDGNPHIPIKISLDADIMTLTENTDYETNEALSKISEAANKYLKEQFNNYLNKVSKEYNVDIDQFSAKAPAHFATIHEFKNFNWLEKYKNSKFDVQIDINVISSMLLTKT